MATNHRLRILLTVPDFDSTRSPYREMIAIARYLPRDEFDLTVCGLRKKGHEEARPLLNDLGVQTFVARFRPKGRSWSHIKDALDDQKVVQEHGPFHIQHSMDFTSSPFEAMMARKGSRAYIFSQRSMNKDSSSIALRVKVHLSERVIAISEPVVDLLIKHGTPQSKLRKVYLGIDLDEIQYRRPVQHSGTKNILSVGHIVPLKGYQYALRAMALLKQKMPDIRLRIAGSSDSPKYFEELQTLLRHLDLAENVEFLGNRRDVIDLMHQSDVLLLASETEALPWVILEAHAAGLPVVASAVDGPREVIEDERNGLLVKQGDVEGFTDALYRILNSPEFAAELSENGRKDIQSKFSAAEMVRQLAAIYREIGS